MSTAVEILLDERPSQLCTLEKFKSERDSDPLLLRRLCSALPFQLQANWELVILCAFVIYPLKVNK